MTKRKRAQAKRTEVTSVRAFLHHLRVAAVPPRVARMFFERHGLPWSLFIEEGIDATDLTATDDAIGNRIAEAAVNDTKPIETARGQIRVYHRHIRAAKICMRGSRAFFAKHGLDWSDFLENGIPVSKLEKIGDPIALRAAHQAIEEETDGRR